MENDASFEASIGSFSFSAHRTLDIAAMPAIVVLIVLILGRFDLLKERLRNEVSKGAGLNSPPSLKLSVEDVLAHSERKCLAAGVLGQGSWWPGRLASYAVLALDDPNERVRLAFIFSGIAWLIVVDIWRCSLQTGLAWCIGGSGFCAILLRRIILAFTPFSQWPDLACVWLWVVLCGALTVLMGEDIGAVSAPICCLLTWVAMLATLVTLRKNRQWADHRLAHITPADCEGSIETLCNWVEKTGVNLTRCGFDAEALLRKYPGECRTVQDVLSNQVSSATRKKLRADGILPALPYRRSQGKACVQFKYRASTIGEFEAGEDPQNFELLTMAVPGTMDEPVPRRVFMCSNVQRPTVVVPVGHNPVPIILGANDIENRQGTNNLYVDVDEVLVVQPCRQRRLREVIHDDREAHGPIRSVWMMTVELVLLVIVSTLAVGWFSFAHDETLVAGATFKIAAIFSAAMVLGQPADYVVIWRLLDRCSRLWYKCVLGMPSGYLRAPHVPVVTWLITRWKRVWRDRGVHSRRWDTVLPLCRCEVARQRDEPGHVGSNWKRKASPRWYFSSRCYTDLTRGVWACFALLCYRTARSIEMGEAEWSRRYHHWTVTLGWILAYWIVVLVDIGLSRGVRSHGLATVVHSSGAREGRHRGRRIRGLDNTSVTPGTHAIIEEPIVARGGGGWWTTLD